MPIATHPAPRRSALGAINCSQLGESRLGVKQCIAMVYDRETGEPVHRFGVFTRRDHTTLNNSMGVYPRACAFDGTNYVVVAHYYTWDKDVNDMYCPEDTRQETILANVFVFDSRFEFVSSFYHYGTAYAENAGAGIYDGKIYLPKYSIEGGWAYAIYEMDGTPVSETPTATQIIAIVMDNDGGGLWICCENEIIRPGITVDPLFSWDKNYSALIYNGEGYLSGFYTTESSAVSHLLRGKIGSGQVALTEIVHRDVDKNNEFLKIRGYDGKIYISNGRVYAAEDLTRLDDYAPLAAFGPHNARYNFEMDSDGNVYIIDTYGLKKYDNNGALIYEKFHFLPIDPRMTICGDCLFAIGGVDHDT